MTRTTTTRRAFAATVAVGLAAGLLAAASPALAKPNGPKPNKPPKPAKPSVTINPSNEAAPACAGPVGSTVNKDVRVKVITRTDGKVVLQVKGTRNADWIDVSQLSEFAAAGANLVKVVVMGYQGDDVICGAALVTNRLYGLNGNDTLIGGDKTDALFGGTGNDRINGMPGTPDKVVTGAGQDLVWVVPGSRVNGKVVPTP